jgi:ribosomal protein L16 Arg81 hydroxylase
MMWIGPPGAFTSLHHDLTNNFIVQVVGRKRVRLLPASEVGKLYNKRHVFSEIPNLENTSIDMDRFHRLAGAITYEVLLEPGDILFMPLAWWHQVPALDFSVTLTYTNFLWPNDAHLTYPQG